MGNAVWTLSSGQYRIGLFAFIKPAVQDLCVGMFPLPCTGEVCLRIESEKWLGADFHFGLFDAFGYFADMDRERGIYAGLSSTSPNPWRSKRSTGGSPLWAMRRYTPPSGTKVIF